MRSVMKLVRFAGGAGLVLVALCGVTLAGGPVSPAAPEIDAGSALSALTLLSGGILMLTDRRKK
jgi:hypothetical protein